MENMNVTNKRENRIVKRVRDFVEPIFEAFRNCSNKVLAYIGWTVCVLFVANLIRGRFPGYELHVQTLSGAIVYFGKDLLG